MAQKKAYKPNPAAELTGRIQKILTDAAQDRSRQEEERQAARTAVAYRPAIVTFVDILGFRDVIGRRDALQIFDLIQEIRTRAGTSDDMQHPGSEGLNWTRVHAFSDSVVRVRTYDSDYREGALFYELIDLVHAQTELAGKGILIRGGMTADDIYSTADLAYGPAFVRAYDLESKLSNYPRIILDPVLIKAVRDDKRLRSSQHTLDEEIQYLRRLVRQGDDGLWFVDYLGASATEFDEYEYYLEFLSRHKQMILEKASALEPTSPLLTKFAWLAKYHNSTVRRLKVPRDRMCRIANSELPILDELLIPKKRA